MHPVLTMREWGHEHHGTSRHVFAHWLSKLVHDYRFWTIVGVTLYLLVVAGLILLASQNRFPTTPAPAVYPFYQF